MKLIVLISVFLCLKATMAADDYSYMSGDPEHRALRSKGRSGGFKSSSFSSSSKSSFSKTYTSYGAYSTSYRPSVLLLYASSGRRYYYDYDYNQERAYPECDLNYQAQLL
jgi:hypothetical protein